MPDNTKISFNIDTTLLKEITRQSQQRPQGTLTQTLNFLIEKGIEADREIKNVKKRENYILLKTLHIMRFLASTRSPEILAEIDASFQEELPTLRKMILEEGMDYVDRGL